jgi:hypothetical protein
LSEYRDSLGEDLNITGRQEFAAALASAIQGRWISDDENSMAKVGVGILVVGGLAWILWTHSLTTCMAMLHLI